MYLYLLNAFKSHENNRKVIEVTFQCQKQNNKGAKFFNLRVNVRSLDVKLI